MTRPQRPKVRLWRWDLDKPTEQTGAQIRTGTVVQFIPAAHLRTLADQLHDLADQLEGAEQ